MEDDDENKLHIIILCRHQPLLDLLHIQMCICPKAYSEENVDVIEMYRVYSFQTFVRIIIIYSSFVRVFVCSFFRITCVL